MNIYKAFSVTFLGFILIFFTQCKEDEGIQPADIVGLWTVSDVELNMTVGDLSFADYLVQEAGMGADAAAYLESLFELEITSSFDGTIEFKEDKTYTLTVGDTETGTWSISNDDGTALTMISSTTGETSEVTISSVNETTLVVVFDETEFMDLNDDGANNEEVAMQLTMTLTK